MKKIHEFLESFLEFKIGDTVYLTTDPEQLPRIVYSYTVYPQHIIYNLTQSTSTSGHFDFEMTHTKDIL